MEPKKKILYVCQEVAPYVAESKYTESFAELIEAMHTRGDEIRTFMPRYGCINERRNQLHEVIRLSGMNLIIDDTDHQLIIKVASIPHTRVQIYFIDNEDFFSRKATLSCEEKGEFEDNDQRAVFFARGVLETVGKLRWSPDIIECRGWFSSFIAAYLRCTFADDPIFANVKIVAAFDGNRYDKALNAGVIETLRSEGIDGEELELLKDATYENLCRFVLKYADGVVIASDDVEQSVIDAARQSGKPIMEFGILNQVQNDEGDQVQDNGEDNYYDKYRLFYENI